MFVLRNNTVYYYIIIHNIRIRAVVIPVAVCMHVWYLRKYKAGRMRVVSLTYGDSDSGEHLRKHGAGEYSHRAIDNRSHVHFGSIKKKKKTPLTRPRLNNAYNVISAFGRNPIYQYKLCAIFIIVTMTVFARIP